MTANEQLLVILRDLLAKSRKNQVIWVRATALSEKFELYFTPEIKLSIEYASPPAEPDWIHVEIETEGRESIGMKLEDGNDDYPLLLDLYNEAYRRATRWDDTLDKINSAIHVDGVIGILPASNDLTY